jgi:hypothetical protein
MLAQYIVARQEFYLYGVCVGYRNVWNRTKRIAGSLPGVKRRPRASPTWWPARILRPNRPSRAASRLRRDMREYSRAGAFGAGSLTLLDRFHHGRVRFVRHADPSAALGSLEPANNQALGAANRGARTRFIIRRNMGLLARSTSVAVPLQYTAHFDGVPRCRPCVNSCVNSLTTKPPPAERSSRPLIGQTVEREWDRRTRDPRASSSRQFRDPLPALDLPDEHLAQVQQGATGLRSDFGAGPPVRLSGTLTMNASRIVTDHRRVSVQIHPAIAIARYRQPGVSNFRTV